MARLARLALMGAALGAAGCGGVRDVALVVHEAPDAATSARDARLTAARLALLDCSVTPTTVAALCTETYTQAASGTTTMQAACHDAPPIETGPGEPLLTAYLRGLGTLADGVPVDPSGHTWLRVLGYGDAGRADPPGLCGLTPALPDAQDGATSELPLYLLCRPAASGVPTVDEQVAAEVFQDYCEGSDFARLF
jgi:hypothetical protein